LIAAAALAARDRRGPYRVGALLSIHRQSRRSANVFLLRKVAPPDSLPGRGAVIPRLLGNLDLTKAAHRLRDLLVVAV
jgi:hypothetical protein